MKSHYSLIALIGLLLFTSCSGKDDDPQAASKFKEIGIAARLDMAGTDLIPGLPDRGIPEVPPTMTKLYAFYYEGAKEIAYGGNVLSSGSDKFGFKRIDQSKPVTFEKISGSSENRRYRVFNASHLFFVNNKADTSALKITNESQLIAFPSQESTNYVYKDATSGGYISLNVVPL